MRAERHAVYPVFLPQAGCPHRCVYCDQRAVTGSGVALAEGLAAVEGIAEIARASGVPGEIAFYGGTFTALPGAILRALLSAAATCVTAGTFTGIRFSTRPDCLGPEIFALLAEYPVTTVEIGAQSLSDAVLSACGRGHDAASVSGPARRVREAGYRLGLQLMAGLPGEGEAGFRESVAAALALAPDFVRLYPVLVLSGTLLERWHEEGRYRPLTLDEALDRCAEGYDAFTKAGITVARMGLQADASLTRPGVIVSGPWHPAFGYLVKVRWWRGRIARALTECGLFGRSAVVRIPARAISEVLGPKRESLAYLSARLGIPEVHVVSDPTLAPGQFHAAAS